MCPWTGIRRNGLLLAVGMLISGAVSAVMIDDFSTSPRHISANPMPGTIAGDFTSSASLGGSRDLFAQITAGSLRANLDIEANFGVLTVSSGGSVEGAAAVVWDGQDGDGESVDVDGLGGVDLTGGGAATGFDLGVLSVDLDLIVSMSVWDMAGGFATASFTRGELAADSFAFSAFGGVDFTRVGAVRLGFQSATPSFDVIVAPLETNDVTARAMAVPLPGTALLFTAGLVGLRLLRRTT